MLFQQISKLSGVAYSSIQQKKKGRISFLDHNKVSPLLLIYIIIKSSSTDAKQINV